MRNKITNNFTAEKLILLAKKKTAQANNILADNITDLFLSNEGRLNEHERALMGSILCKLISSVERSIRVQMSKKLALEPNIPSELMLFLANDHIDVAVHVLKEYEMLVDKDLLEIIRNRTDAHRMAIAIRSTVSADVCDELIIESSDDVIEQLIKNSGAEISKSALKYLVLESKTVDHFQEPLLNREDLPSNLAHKMYWWVSVKLRSKILRKFKISEGLLDDLIETSTFASIRQDTKISSVMEKALELALRLSYEKKLNVNFILKILRQEKINLAIASFSILINLNINLIWRIFREKTGESLAVICKTLDIERNEFTSLYLLLQQVRSGSKIQATSLLTSVLEMYDELNVKDASNVVEFWRKDEQCKNNSLLDEEPFKYKLDVNERRAI